MPGNYVVDFTDIVKQPITVQPLTVNTTTSLKMLGYRYPTVGEVLWENMLHMMEHFAAPTPPVNPVQGQVWANTSVSPLVLNVYDNSAWIPLSTGAYTLPTASASVLGGVKVGSGLTIDTNGVLTNSVSQYTLPTASATVMGGIRVGSGLSISGTGVLSSTAQYTLPTATISVLGGVKVDGTTITITNDGIISSTGGGGGGGYTLPIASSSTLGGVKVGTGLAINGTGVLSNTVTQYTLPIATPTILGGVKVGPGLVIDSFGLLTNTYTLPLASTTTVGGVKVDGTTIVIAGDGTISSTGGGGGGGYTLPTATASILGGVKVGSGLSISGSGVLSADAVASYTLPTASASVLGGVKVGSGLTISGTGVLSASATSYTLPIATASSLGGIKVGTGLSIDTNGVLSRAAGLSVSGSLASSIVAMNTTEYTVFNFTFNSQGLPVDFQAVATYFGSSNLTFRLKVAGSTVKTWTPVSGATGSGTGVLTHYIASPGTGTVQYTLTVADTYNASSGDGAAITVFAGATYIAIQR